jgi:hypothetical protein
MKQKMKMTMKSITLSHKEVEKITEKADKYGITFSETLRRIVDKYFEDEEKQKNDK